MKSILVDAWNTFVTENGMNHDLKKLLDSFPNHKIILTNANQQECITYGIVNMPYEVFSLEHNPNKTDKAYYICMFEKYNLEPSDVIYFEHNIEAVNSAISAGIKTHHYKKEDDLVDLHSFLRNNLE